MNLKFKKGEDNVKDVMAAIKELGYSIGLNSENGKLQVLDFNVTFQ